MRPKFEWILNIIFGLLVLIIGSLLVYLSQFRLGMVVEGLAFYGGIAYLLFSIYYQPKHKEPRRVFTKRGFTSNLGAGLGLLAVLLSRAYLFS
ncbi:hypothetical protein EON83_15595 [bacterium]|nr:MAG: hypothetical protein EON83_15595 [bacterium]